ncbi:MAG: hypothetical protein M1835_003941, partial [Candelina submexicana]
MGREGFEASKEEMDKKYATGTMGRVEDVAEAYLYLMKDGICYGDLVRRWMVGFGLCEGQRGAGHCKEKGEIRDD